MTVGKEILSLHLFGGFVSKKKNSKGERNGGGTKRSVSYRIALFCLHSSTKG